MNTAQYNALFSFIWNIANDVLVHIVEQTEYKKVILPFLVLRRIDILLEPTKHEVMKKKEFCDKNSAGYVCLPDDGGSVVIAK